MNADALYLDLKHKLGDVMPEAELILKAEVAAEAAAKQAAEEAARRAAASAPEKCSAYPRTDDAYRPCGLASRASFSISAPAGKRIPSATPRRSRSSARRRPTRARARRNARRGGAQLVDNGAIFQLFVHVGRLARERERVDARLAALAGELPGVPAALAPGFHYLWLPAAP